MLFGGADILNVNDAESIVALAETLAGNYVCPGVPNVFSKTTRVATFRLVDRPPAWNVPQYGEYRIPVRWLRDGNGFTAWPITGLTSVKMDGVDVTSSCVWTMFSIQMDRLVGPFLPFSLLEVTYQTGWADADAAPQGIRQAVSRLAQLIKSNPNGLKSRSLGGVMSAEYLPWNQMLAQGGLPVDVQVLLNPYRYVEFHG
jgi:hypothetical protein